MAITTNKSSAVKKYTVPDLDRDSVSDESEDRETSSDFSGS